jgi:plasmid maintenance system antidote protein VapI
MSIAIKKRLTELGLSQSKTARLADIPQPDFNLIVNGKRHACPAWRKRIAATLGMSEEELFSINGEAS